MSFQNTIDSTGKWVSDSSANLYEYLTPSDEQWEEHKTDKGDEIADMYYDSDTGEGKRYDDTQLTEMAGQMIGEHDRDAQIGFSGHDYAQMAGWAAKGILAIKSMSSNKQGRSVGGRYGTGTTASQSARGIYSILGLK